jgi:hypothetical protein
MRPEIRPASPGRAGTRQLVGQDPRFEVPGGPIDTSKLAVMVGGWR